MNGPSHITPQITVLKPQPLQALATLRCAYFAVGGEPAARYHIGFDRVLTHLWQARQVNRRLRIGLVAGVEDVIHAAACVDNNGLAWAELAERHERALIRRGRNGNNEISAILTVRRMFADLRHRSCAPGSITSLDLRSYWGNRPLRTWLSDRLSAILAREAIDQARLQQALQRAKLQQHSPFDAAGLLRPPSPQDFHAAANGVSPHATGFDAHEHDGKPDAVLRFPLLPDSLAS